MDTGKNGLVLSSICGFMKDADDLAFVGVSNASNGCDGNVNHLMVVDSGDVNISFWGGVSNKFDVRFCNCCIRPPVDEGMWLSSVFAG